LTRGILAIAALDLLKSNQLRDNALVATVMSNFGLDEALARQRWQSYSHQSGRSLRELKKWVSRNLISVANRAGTLSSAISQLP